MGSTETSGNVGAITTCLTAFATDLALATGLIANPDSLEGGAVSPEAAVVSLAVVLCIVGAAATGDVAPAGLSAGFGHLSPI